MYEAYATDEKCSDDLLYHETSSMVISALIKHFMTENVLQEAHDKVSQACQRSGKDELELETQCIEQPRQCRHIISATEKVNYLDSGLQPSICKVMLEELHCMPSNVRSVLFKMESLLLLMNTRSEH